MVSLSIIDEKTGPWLSDAIEYIRCKAYKGNNAYQCVRPLG